MVEIQAINRWDIVAVVVVSVVVVVVNPGNLLLKLGKNQVIYRWDVVNVVVVSVVVSVVVVGVVVVVVSVVVVVVVHPRNLTLKFGWNRVSNSCDVEFVWVGGGWWIKVIFMSHPTFELSWGWVGVVTKIVSVSWEPIFLKQVLSIFS